MSDQIPVISARSPDGSPVPVAFRLIIKDAEGNVSTGLVFPEGRHWWVREERENGREVEVEPLFELPDEMVTPWIVNQVLSVAPAADVAPLKELLGRATRRAAQLRSGEIALHRRETLFVAVRPGEDAVRDLAFTARGGANYARQGHEWVRQPLSDLDDPVVLHPVKSGAVALFDERSETNLEVLLSELAAKKLTLGDVGNTGAQRQ